MPTYEYRCVECDNQYETKEGFDAPSTQPCPKCGGRARRVFSPPPIVFKGSGWYITDSRKGSSATVTSSSGSDDGSGESKAPAATTSTPEPAKTTTSSAED